MESGGVDRSFTRFGLKHLVPVPAQRGGDQSTNAWFVLDHEHRDAVHRCGSHSRVLEIAG